MVTSTARGGAAGIVAAILTFWPWPVPTLERVASSNFREDINASGRIDAADVSVVRQQTLTSLP